MVERAELCPVPEVEDLDVLVAAAGDHELSAGAERLDDAGVSVVGEGGLEGGRAVLLGGGQEAQDELLVAAHEDLVVGEQVHLAVSLSRCEICNN